MKYFLITIAFVFTIANIVSAGDRELADSWMQQHQSKLILQWGPPSSTSDDGNDGKILIYDFGRTTGGRGGTIKPTYGGGVRYENDPQFTYVEVWQFYINPDGIIYHVRYQSNKGSFDFMFAFVLLLIGVTLVVFIPT